MTSILARRSYAGTGAGVAGVARTVATDAGVPGGHRANSNPLVWPVGPDGFAPCGLAVAVAVAAAGQGNSGLPTSFLRQ